MPTMYSDYDYDEALERFHKTLAVAVKNDAMTMVMDTLTKIAHMLMKKNEKERSVEILTIVLQYPLRPATLAYAEGLYMELEAEVCPRVLADARALAAEITLDDLLSAILDGGG